MLKRIKRSIRDFRLMLWVRRHAKPFRTTAYCNDFEWMTREEAEKHHLPVTDKVGWDQIAYRELKDILGTRPEVGTYEWWEDPDDNPRYVLHGTPGFRIELDSVPYPDKWKPAKGGYFIPAYETEF